MTRNDVWIVSNKLFYTLIELLLILTEVLFVIKEVSHRQQTESQHLTMVEYIDHANL
jgi:hypothetical protein